MIAVLGDQLDKYAEDVRRDGFCVLRGFFDPVVINEWKAAFDRVFAERASRSGGLAPRDPGRWYLTLPWEVPFANPDVFANETVLDVVRRVLGSDAFDIVQLAADVPVLGSTYQDLHRDHQPLWGDDFPTPLFALAVNVPLVDIDASNGPLEIALGTHHLAKDDALRRIAAGEIALEPVFLERGDVLIRTPLALHRGTPNTTERPRPVVVMGCALAWLRDPKVDLRIPYAVYESFPVSVQQRLRATVVHDLDAGRETYLDFRY